MRTQVLISMDRLTTIEKFCKLAMNVDGGVLLKRGKFVVDGSSILGVIGINPVEPCMVEYDISQNTAEFSDFIAEISIR